MNRSAFGLATIAWIAAACFSGYRETPPQREDRVHRGNFVSEVTLTGELEAARGEAITVPNLPSWQTSIKWVADDGAEVKKGDRVVELDNSQFTSGLDAKRQAVAQAEQELQQKDAEGDADMLQKKLDVETKKSDYEKTKLDAAVPKEILSAREYEDRKIKYKRATVELAKAKDVLRSSITASRSDRSNLILNLEKARRELDTAETAINALILRSPRDGIVVLRDHPWEGRKIKEGDPVFVGLLLALLPDLSSTQVTASLADVDDRKISVGMPATVVLDAYPSMTFPGRVAAISAVAQENTTNRQSLRRSFRVTIKLDRLDALRMRPGLSARVTIRRATRSNVLLAPRGVLARKDIKLGECNDLECVVVSGLKEGDRI
ncbi:MAG TPA: HlyD family efflux transporter periplasmic adaptor subunit [Thermoanaerobaculia bacterium]|nr:HlyD family efflux transporter periplasmic adaptor subunit [Thermoanaerobaculia bacterium]